MVVRGYEALDNDDKDKADDLLVDPTAETILLKHFRGEIKDLEATQLEVLAPD